MKALRSCEILEKGGESGICCTSLIMVRRMVWRRSPWGSKAKLETLSEDKMEIKENLV